MSPILVTSCSSRKSVQHGERLHAADLPNGDLDYVGQVWRAWLKDHHCWLPATDMYCGRGFQEARKASKVASTEHWIVSAGLGLIAEVEQIPAYDLTVSGTGGNQIRKKIERDKFTVQRWWGELVKRRKPHRTLTRLVERNANSTVILAMPTSYLSMVVDDLRELDANGRARLRIIGPPEKAVPSFLRPYWLPYDQRLDGPGSPLPGTRSDFPQRAARHFLETIWPVTESGSVSLHAKAVQDYLASLPYPSTPKRKQLDDQNIILLIRRLWSRAEGKSGRMLRLLRDEEQVACEQGRFKQLFQKAKEQMDLAI